MVYSRCYRNAISRDSVYILYLLIANLGARARLWNVIEKLSPMWQYRATYASWLIGVARIGIDIFNYEISDPALAELGWQSGYG